MSIAKLLQFPKHEDSRGWLYVIEETISVPIDIKRVYYMGSLSAERRGYHAHHELIQVAVCLSGSCKILLDDNRETEEVLLNSPGMGLIIDKMVWHEMFAFSEDCILLVLANDFYAADDYIRDFEVFRSMGEKHQG